MKAGTAGSFYLIGIGLLLAGVGGIFTALLGSSYLRARSMDQWQETPCVILESEVRERQIGPAVPVDYSLGILYGYDFAGEPYSSENYDLRGNAWVKESAKIRALVQKFPAGSRQICWVNPAQPAQAVLKKETKAPGYSLWFPVLFVVGGLGLIARALLRIVRPAKPTGEED
ncbi:DUF3592 domain-containing protein [Roseibacillus ishigakijimensis]|uniref:DUF3592 domain-containing protein n=1 Tax=Roseibacillus ishigakijimensis TaxID=454146 RepID=A0A934RR57_9BACT|nr:DUF3592 domain-containing protein [Roseibacillus ishigakijimensis]MBK1834387.1 DUF3592 domain-containing protein [Roseibacillus ishigakijimensis]